MLRTNRLDYTFYAASFLEKRDAEEVTADVLQHLDGAYDALCQSWGQTEWVRLSSVPLNQLDEKIQNRLVDILDQQLNLEVENQPLEKLINGKKELVIDQLGRQALTEQYRRLLLGVSTELWVEYLTQMESLRVSIGLEAYAQRDPLVQYKNRASELFQNLVGSMRMGVVTRMFTYRPPEPTSVTPAKIRTESIPSETTRPEAAPDVIWVEGSVEPVAEAETPVVASAVGTAARSTQVDSRPSPSGGSAAGKSPGKRKRHRRH
jgi:preprotein translocase subunit SecA